MMCGGEGDGWLVRGGPSEAAGEASTDVLVWERAS